MMALMTTPETQDDGLNFPALRDLYPGRTDEELREADRALSRYLDIVIRIYRRSHDPLTQDGRSTGHRRRDTPSQS